MFVFVGGLSYFSLGLHERLRLVKRYLSDESAC